MGRRRKIVGRWRRCRKREKGKRRTVTGITAAPKVPQATGERRVNEKQKQSDASPGVCEEKGKKGRSVRRDIQRQ